MSAKYKKLLLVLIFGFAIFIRLWKISKVPVSLFGDELDVGYQAYSILKTGKDYMGNFMPLHFHSMAEWRTPLYLYSSVPTVGIFGISPLGVRLPAVFFGILGVVMMYLLTKEIFNLDGISSEKQKIAESVAIVAAFVMAFSPWHIQYSRAAFEVTQFLFFLLAGIYLFLRSLKNDKYLWLSALCFGLTPWIYSTGKLFAPMIMGFLFIFWFGDIIKMKRKSIICAVIALLIVGLPMVYAIFSEGGAQRFGYISVFTDPTMNGDVGFARLNDAKVEGSSRNVLLKLESRVVHNKYTFWGAKIINNYLSSFSTDFLFIRGDINLRHSIENIGQFYKVEAFALLLGFSSLFLLFKNRKVKLLLGFWILAGVIPSSITRDGGTHATRLITILPPLVILIAYGLSEGTKVFGKNLRRLILMVYAVIFIISFAFYQHNYWLHNPWYSERWWHAGFKEMVEEVKKQENNYDRIIISNANEPPKIFFLGWYMYPPELWQKGLQEEFVNGFETMEHTGKFYFGQVDVEGIYALGGKMDNRTLYVAVERELGFNLFMEPTRVPAGLHLVKAIAYPSGEPAFYLFDKAK